MATQIVTIPERIGSAAGLHAPRDARFGPNGFIYIADGMGPAIHVFSRQGAPVAQVGRGGQGPGEFAAIDGFGFHGDTMWVFDNTLRRFSYFELDGKLIRTVDVGGIVASVAMESATVQVGPTRIGDNGLMIGEPLSAAVLTRGDSLLAPRFTFGEDGAVRDTLSPMWMFNFGFSRRGVAVGGVEIREERPLTRSVPFRAQDKDGIVRMEQMSTGTVPLGVFKVSKVKFDGDTIFALSFGYRPRRVEDAYRDSVVKQREEWYARRGVLDGAIRTALDAMTIVPVHYPPVSMVVVGPDGSIWLRREDDLRPDRVWIVISSGGLVRGSVTLPREQRMVTAEEERIIVIDEDVVGRRSVIVYEVEFPRSSAG